jgi:hypothetical protein
MLHDAMARERGPGWRTIRPPFGRRAMPRWRPAPLEHLQDHGLVFVSLRHDRLRLCSNRITTGWITSGDVPFDVEIRRRLR